MSNSSRTPFLDEAAARRVLLVQGMESAAAPTDAWRTEDRSWATQRARETAPPDATPARYLAERAEHALQRLAPREPALAQALRRRIWHPLWLPLAALLGLVAGLAADAIGSSQRISLLAPSIWALVAWNLGVYLALLLPGPRLAPGPRAWLARWVRRWAGPLHAGRTGLGAGHEGIAAGQALWARRSTPLTLQRVALLLHAGAAALAVGLILGLYLRGLVLDYRAGWQSTFLGAEQVHALLAWLLAPAVAVTGIAVPDAQAMALLRVLPGAAATASAAPWIHLYATLLGLLVVAPRVLLALAAAWRARGLSRQFPLDLDEAYFRRLLRERAGTAARVQVLPHAAQPSERTMSGLRELLGAALDAAVQLDLCDSTPYGQEERAAGLAPAAGTSLRVALVDLASTPEADTQGRFLAALRGASDLPLLLVADEAAFRRRFAQLPERLVQRRQAWQELAQARGAAWFSADLEQPELGAGLAPLRRALRS